MDKTTRQRDAITYKEILKIALSHRGKAVAFHPNGKTILTGSYGKNVMVWGTTTGSEQAALVVGPGFGYGIVEGLAMSPEGSFFISVGGDGVAQILDASDFKTLHSLTLASSISSVAISPDGSRAVFGLNDWTVGVFDVSHGTPLLTLRGHSREIATVAFSPDGERIASGDSGGEIRIWDSVPFRERLKEYELLQAARSEAEKLVARLLVNLPTRQAVATDLRNNASLPPVLRQAALNELLRRAVDE